LSNDNSREPASDSADLPPITVWLAAINKGAVVSEATAALAELVNRVRATGRKGTVKLTIEVSPFKGGDANVNVAAAVELKLPKGDPHAAVFYPDAKGGLHRNDPRMEPLFSLNEAPRPALEGGSH